MNEDIDSPSLEQICLHLGEEPERYMGSVVPPIFQNSLFTAPNVEARSRRGERYIYTRESNPTTDILNTKLAAMEGAEAARCFASGMAAISAALMSQLRSSDHVVCVQNVYYPVRVLLQDYLNRFGVEVSFVRGTQVEHFEQAKNAQDPHKAQNPSSSPCSSPNNNATPPCALHRHAQRILLCFQQSGT